MWWGGGSRGWLHSRAEGGWDEATTGRWEAKASHIIIIKKRVATKDIRAPKEDTMFHIVKESG